MALKFAWVSLWKLAIASNWFRNGCISCGSRKAVLNSLSALPLSGRAVKFPNPFPEWKS